jgi:5-methyltetrahydropteroyltriglutamate--homocysteine methyltransferase
VKGSARRILSTHVGSLPRPPGFATALHAKDTGRDHDREALARQVSESIVEVVKRQVELGIDVINDGEHSKSSFAAYGRMRLGGISETDESASHRGQTRDALAFPEVYKELALMNAARGSEKGTARGQLRARATVCTGPITYVGQEAVARDIADLKAALRGQPVEEAFITAISPTNLELYHPNRHYRSDEEYLEALANAMNVEYRAIVDAGFVLQIDDPRLATHYNRSPGSSIEECRRFIGLRVETVNHSLRGIPRDRVRFHTCYSVNVAPRVHDMELKDYIDLMLRINAQAFTFEASNPRHEHEWEVWQSARIPDDVILMPGVVSHCLQLVEHPELVAQRIERYAGIVGRERVVASNDCGFATSAAGDELHPHVAWAKMQSLVAGARIASSKLWGRRSAA